MLSALLFCACCCWLAAAADRPNIVYIMADDLEFDYKQNRLEIMPTLKKYFAQEGLTFLEHVATVPVCGPSRSSWLAGKFPHNTGYLMNGDKASVEAWGKKQNDTVGRWLRESGYHTAFFGKYVNGMEKDVVAGWSHYGGFSSGVGTYNFYNATIYDVDFDGMSPQQVKQHTMTDVHQADFLGQFALKQVDKAVQSNKPFFISMTPVMVHWGTCIGPNPPHGYPPNDPHWEWSINFPCDPCPTHRHAQDFVGHTNPHLASWNTSAQGHIPMDVMRKYPPLSQFKSDREDICFRNRSSSCEDLDDMIKVVIDGLETRGLLNNTYIFFTSDNGYHLGEHRMPFGKGTPYSTDVKLPFYVRGPGVAAGLRHHPTQHTDIVPTILELAQAEATSPGLAQLDGKSFASVLSANPPSVTEWRDFQFSEFFMNNDTWWMYRKYDDNGPVFSYHHWCKNNGPEHDTEVFDLRKDPLQLNNLAYLDPFGLNVTRTYLPIAIALAHCNNHQDCFQPVPVPHNGTANPLECYLVQKVEGFDYDP
eukprot:m.123940 g.123940  ORF g.123940 m.123940 type:complete len:533 (-) comp19723_c0_seq1:51-1649(-)